MAERIMAGRLTPASPASPASPAFTTSTASTVAAGTAGPSSADLLENKLEQLKSLLWCCYGDGVDWFQGEGPQHLDNVLWIASDLANEAAQLFQQCDEERSAPS